MIKKTQGSTHPCKIPHKERNQLVMKKVISALTAAAMCASMSASVMSVFAVDPAGAEIYLKATSAGAGTISEDGSTITFASAADAAGAKLTIQEFIKADNTEPYVQQVITAITTSSKSISLKNGVSLVDPYGDEKEYKIGENTTKTNLFVNCFAQVNKRGKLTNPSDQTLWGHSSEFTFDYDGPDILNYIWQCAKGAEFANGNSESFPFTEFYAEIGSDIKDGTYTIEIPETWENKNKKNPTTPGAIMDVGNGEVTVTKTKKITIKVGNAGAETPTEKETTKETEKATEAPTEKETAKETEKATEAPTEKATESSTPAGPSMDDKKNSKDWTWYADDVVYDPAADPDKMGVAVNVYVTKDPGTYGFQFTPQIDGKGLDASGFEFEVEQADGGYAFTTFTSNEENGKTGGSFAEKKNAQVADGTAVVTFYVVPPADAKPGQTYKFSIKELLVGDFEEKQYTPATIDGSITIAGGTDTPETPTEKETEKTTEAPTEKETEAQPQSDEWLWYADDVVYDPAADPDKLGVALNVRVKKDPGTYGFQFTPQINGKGLDASGFEFEVEQADGGYAFTTFTSNEDNGKTGGSFAEKKNAQVKDDTAVVTFYLVPPADAAPGTKYTFDIAELLVGDFEEKQYTPATKSGSITIKGEGTTEAIPTETEKETQKETTAPDTQPSTPDKPLYGDVNVDGKVELVDVVKLNRYLAKIDKEMTGVAVINANCYRAKNESDADTTVADLSGEDSVEILKYLIKLVAELPTKAG
jgi:hypothetical protein